ncbi:MAG: HAMP domain-containing histidine kinase [Chitinispirillaceae bacterium]|nr:HAMP domain-containing histidine kinase [Chitinispirillaceae bacterium]
MRGIITKIKASFDDWVRSLDPAQRKTTTSRAAVAIAAIIGFSGMAVAGLVPGPRDFFSLRFIPASLCFIAALIPAMVMDFLERREELSSAAFGWISLLGAALFQFYMWSLVAFSSLPGATVMAAFPVLLASFHGHLFHSDIRLPFPIMASVVAASCGLFLNTDAAHVAIMSIAAPTALGTNLLLGLFARSDYYKRTEQAALREAVDAQILQDRTRTIVRISQTLEELRGSSHDAGNALSGLLLMMPQFVSLARSKPLTAEKLREAADVAEMLLTSLKSLQTILSEARQSARQNDPESAAVAPADVVREVLAAARRQFPGIAFVNSIPAAFAGVQIPFFGGPEALRRVMNNLVINACQGNGTAAAARVETGMSLSPDGRELLIIVTDDGPGFTPVQLAGPLTGFQTTKKHGTGLGLYTALRVLKANNGSLIRGNRSGGAGAVVTVKLKIDERLI